MNARYGLGEVLFSLKCFLAAMLAYWLALRIGLTRPYWAVTTAYIVSQPLAGAVLSKAVFRAVGTVVGAAAAVILVPNLVNTPALLSLALALWLGFCLYVSLLDRTPRAYLFLLAGYTASIIGFPAVAVPDQIFAIAIARVQEITLGILCGSLVHAAILPQTVTSVLHARIEEILRDAERWSRDSLGSDSDPKLDADRRRLALDINELHQLSIHLPFDMARFLPRIRTVRALQDQLSMILPLASAIDDRMTLLGARAAALDPVLGGLIGRVRDWLATLSDAPERRPDAAGWRAAADALIAEARALEPAIGRPVAWGDALRLNLLARLQDLIAAHRDCRDLSDQLRSPLRTPVTPRVGELLTHRRRRTFHRDHRAALRAALGTIATIILGCTFWIATAWPDGAGAVLIAGVCCALFGAADDPAPIISVFLKGMIAGTLVSAVYIFAILPGVEDFATLAAVLAPACLLIGVFLARPQTTLFATGLLLGFLNTVGLNDRYAADFPAFANGALAQIIGTGFAVITVGLFQTVGSERSARRLIVAGWRDLGRRSNLARKPDATGWVSRMLDRIGLLAPRLARRGKDPGKPLFDALRDLRVGVSIAELRQLRIDTGPAEEAFITPVLEGVGRHYAALDPDDPAPPPPALRAAIDRAVTELAASRAAETRRSGVLTLTSLRRNLFPADLPVGQVAS